MKKYILILRNKSGAAERVTVNSKTEARRWIRLRWSDPKNLTAELIENDPDDGGVSVYEGPATRL